MGRGTDISAPAIKKVLAGLDFSGPSQQALAAGADWAAPLGVPLELIHVLPEPPMIGSAEYPLPLPDPAWRKDMEAWAAAKFDEAAKGHPGATAGALGPGGRYAPRRGHSALARFFFGSTASRAAAHAEGPVLPVGSRHPA
jgi:nucleotide-binding universal stress UspA family protein